MRRWGREEDITLFIDKFISAQLLYIYISSFLGIFCCLERIQLSILSVPFEVFLYK